MKSPSVPRVLRVFSVALAVAHFIGQTVLGHAAEANFWAQRAETARRFRGGAVTPTPLWGTLPLDVPPVVGREIPSSSTSTDWARVFGGHGHVRGHQPGAQGVVLHVQDVHGHRNAQKNIAALVRAVLDRRPGATVLLEGAAGPISLESLRSAGDDRNAAVAGFFFNAGILSGAEAAVYGAPGAPRVAGAENPAEYISNRRAVDDARAARPDWERRLSGWTAAVQSAKPVVYSPRALSLDRQAAAWSGEGAFLERAAFLGAAPNLPPPPPGSALERFVRLIALEKSLSPEAAARERGVFLEQLADRLNPVEVQSLAADAMALRGGAMSPGAFYAGVRALAGRRGVRLAEFPAFDAYVAYTALAERVRPEALEAELNEREARLWTAVALTPPERDLRALDEALREMRRLIALSMTPADWRAHLAGGADRGHLKRRLAAVGVAAPGFDGLEVFESFYRLAEARNHALAEAAEIAARAGEPVVLVAGGFHNSGVAALLAARGIEFLSVAPKLGDAGDAARGPFDIFFRDHTPLEELFQSPRVSLAETPGLAPLTPDGIPRARAVRELGPLVRSALASPGDPQTAPALDGGRTIVIARSPEGPEPTVAGARPVVTSVSVDLDGLSNGSDVSVFHRNGAPWGRWWSRWKSPHGFFAKGRSKLFGAALLAAFLIPLAAVSPAHAYTLVEGPAGVHVVVNKGEHLWGAAAHVLKAGGERNPSNPHIAAKVKEMAELNGLTNPDLIHPQTLYMATPAPVSVDSPTNVAPPADLSGGRPADAVPGIVPLDNGTASLPLSPSISPVAPPAVAGAGINTAAPAEAGSTVPLPSTNARGDSVFPAPSAGFVATVAAALLLLTAWGGRAYSHRRWGGAFHRAWNRARQSAREGIAAIAEVLHPATGKGRDPLTSFLLAATGIAALSLVPGVADWGPAMFSWFDAAELVDQTRAFLVGQWPVLAALGTGLLGAVYYVWFRDKEVDLAAIEKNEARVRDWITLLDRLEQNETLSEEDLSWLANNVHALILNNRVTPAAVSDRGQMEKRIDAYRAIARLSERTVRLLDRRLETGGFAVGNTRDRLVDTREKFFLYQLYGLKTAHALVPASVAHWALSNFDRRDSWFEKKKLGAVLRFVRGVRPMIRQTVEEYRGRMLTDDTRPGRTLWERAEGLSVVSLGNVLVPGLYDGQDKSDLARVFDSLQKKSETKELSDMSAKDLHRKGWGTMISLLLWSVAISRMVSVFPAVLAFFTGLGVTMALFRIQTLGTRRDGFFRAGLRAWREMNQRPHVNGRLKGIGESAGEDPFHLNRDFARFHLQEAEDALREELAAGEPSTDIVLLIAQNEEERSYFESRSTDRALFPPSVPVVVLTVPSRRGSFAAYARAWTYLFSEEYKSLAERHPRLNGRAPWTLNAATLVAKGGAVEGMNKPLAGLPLFANRLGAGALGARTIFDLAVMNAYRATRARTEGGERGGLALRWADRAYVGPVRVSAGTGVTLDTQWVNREDMDRFNFGAVIASLEKPIKLIRRSRVEKTLGLLAEEHTNRVYDLRNDRLKQIQAFSGEGFYAFDAAAAAAHHEFLKDVIARSDSLPAEANLDPPSLNLMTYYLVPLCIAQARDAEVSHKINVYFSGHGFLSDPLPEAIQHFNNRSANALAATFREEARPTFSLNAAFVDESLYASVDAAVEQDEAEFDPGTEPPDAPRWRDRIRRVVRNGTVHAFLLLGMFFPAMAAAGSKGAAVESAWGGPVPFVAAVAGASLSQGGLWRRVVSQWGALFNRRGGWVLAAVGGGIALFSLMGTGMSWAGGADFEGGVWATARDRLELLRGGIPSGPWAQGALGLMGGFLVGSALLNVKHIFGRGTSAPHKRSREWVNVTEESLSFEKARAVLAMEIKALRARNRSGSAAAWAALLARAESETAALAPVDNEPNRGDIDFHAAGSIPRAAAKVLILQLAEAIETRRAGFRPTAEIFHFARLWGLALGESDDLQDFLDPLLPDRLRGTVPTPVFQSWLGGMLSTGPKGEKDVAVFGTVPVRRTVRPVEAPSAGPAVGWRKATRGSVNAVLLLGALSLAPAGFPSPVVDAAWTGSAPAVAAVAGVSISQHGRRGFGGAAAAARTFFSRVGRWAVDRLTGGKALRGVKIALLPVALFVNYGGLVQAFGSAGALVFAPALLLIPAFFLTVFELFVDDLIALRLGTTPAPVSAAAPGRSPRRSTAVDVTTESWSHPEETVTALAEILSAVRSSDRRNAAAERELTRLLVRAAAELPLEDDLAGRLSLSWLRADVAKAEETRARRMARRAADPRGEGRARVDEVAELSLAHQIARAWKAHRRGVVPAAEFRQVWYLRGMMGRPLPDGSGGDALLGTLGPLWGVAGVGGAREWSNGARKLAGLLKGVSGVPAGDAEAELTMIRVSEFLPGAGEGAARRPVLEKHLIERAKRFRPGAHAGDVLIVNGRGADETRIKNLLRRRVSGFPAFDAYLAACRVVVLPEERFTPEAVIAALPNTTTRGKTLNLFTADPTAILINPHRTHLSYRVLLLEWVGGELMAVDLLDLARRALKAARVVATSA
ncbi:MAG: hypothetical protein IPI26_02930 [Elusimicrobia bacterium]|nr:hypothetical protein [Elusimicrobiota bacterium]